ncbi:MAG: Wadjet anti-phage system protein JetA family protein [Faecalibacterium sp.]
MQLFELVSPRLFRPLAGPNRALYAELLLLLWEECRHTADYSLPRAEAVSRAEDYFAALAKPVALDDDAAGDEAAPPTRDPHVLALGFLLRLRRTGWLEEQPGSYDQEPGLAFVPEVAPVLEALEAILNPRVETYSGKLYKAWRLLQGVEEDKSPYENVLREVAADLDALNRSLRSLNASIGHYLDRLTRNRTPQEVLELFDQYEEKVVAAAYHRFKTSDNLFNYRAALEEGLDQCELKYLPQLALDYARVERCAPAEAAPAVRALLQRMRDALEEMTLLIREIDASHVRYRKRAVQRAQFLLLSDRSSQGSITALLRRYAEDIRTPEQLFEPDDGPAAARLKLWPAQVFGPKPLYPPAAPRAEAPPTPVGDTVLDPARLQQEQKLLLEYARLAVTEENVGLLARQALAARPETAASTLVDEYPGELARVIGLHTYSQSPRRGYEIRLTGQWVERGGFRFEDFILTRRMEGTDDGSTRGE